MSTYASLGLNQTVRVGLDRYPEWGSPLAVPGPIERGIPVPHEAANIPCGQFIGSHQPWLAQGDDTVMNRYCKKRVGHATPKGEEPHVAQDHRVVASPRRVVHEERFKPNTLPAGVDQSITTPHDCDNHLEDVSAVAFEAFRRGR